MKFETLRIDNEDIAWSPLDMAGIYRAFTSLDKMGILKVNDSNIFTVLTWITRKGALHRW